MENEVSMSQPCPDPVRIAVTMGDPAGVGPELCAKILSDPPVNETQLIVFGDWQWLHHSPGRGDLRRRGDRRGL